jgi:asparagine synthase (glutamine-hydrolysing)
MCGIAGWFGSDSAGEDAQGRLVAMCDAIRHRGPDDAGYWHGPRVALGMRRLSIVDLEGGHQPMRSPCGRFTLVFNGEIYNHCELRDELRAHGAAFATHSDTEVILAAWLVWGAACLDRLNGMFAIALHDAREGVLHLVRDRMGVKPLYYLPCADGSIAFASEIKSLRAGGFLGDEIDPLALWDYLTFRYVPGPRSLWAGVQKLAPGHRMELRTGEQRTLCWWRHDIRSRTDRACGDAEASTFDRLFTDAVGLRLRADVPVGILLSGGLDSAAVTAAAAGVQPAGRLLTFSVAFAGADEIDERRYAREVAAAFGTQHHEVVIDERSFLEGLESLPWMTDEPLADLATVPLAAVCRLAGEHVKVVLSGEGSDELLAGYDFDRWLAAVTASPQGTGGGLLRRLARRVGWRPALGDQRYCPVPASMTNLMQSDQKQRLMGLDQPLRDSLDPARDLLKSLGSRHPLDQALSLYCRDWLVEDLLMKADRASMAHSVELRTPFLDYRLVEFASKLPVDCKVGPDGLGGSTTKRILRRWAASRLPRTIVERPKMGFPVPVLGWLSGRLAGWVRELLDPRSAHIAGWLNPQEILGIVMAGTSLDADTLARHRLMSLVVLELWARAWRPA